MERDLRFRIVLEKPPANVDFGLQKGRGGGYETVQKQRSKTKDLYFTFVARVKADSKAATLSFLGQFVQGPPAQRFVYLDIGTLAGQTDSCWSRRLKVPLSGISRKMIDRMLADSTAVFEARVPGTGRDGGPNCGTVKPFTGWRMTPASHA